MSTISVAAVDLGATSGRVMLGRVGVNELSLHPVARFANQPVRVADGLHWNILELYRNVLVGLTDAARMEEDLASVGIDSWGVDYALLRGDRMLGAPFHYRDDRSAAGVDRVHSAVSHEELYAANGLQFLQFNTLYQLATEELDGLDATTAMLLIPDLLGFWLTGRSVAERSNASTTGLLGVATREWDDSLIARLGLRRSLFPELVDAGTTIGAITADIGLATGRRALELIAVGSHDTASAVVAIPATSIDIAYISCGTWGLVGVELEQPVLTEAARAANFTNEGGVDGRVRFLHNVMGLWLLSESVREWERGGETVDLGRLLGEAAAEAAVGQGTDATDAGALTFDAEDPRFLAPGDMPARIRGWFEERGLQAPSTRAQVVRSIVQSLAAAFARAIDDASRLSGRNVDTVHIVGGGSQNVLLCQLTADATGLPVHAGPVEATALGNVLVQARTHGALRGDLESLRALVARTHRPTVYTPR